MKYGNESQFQSNFTFKCSHFCCFFKTKKFKEIRILRTKAKPPKKFSHDRHNVILLKMVIFRGGLTLEPNCCRQPQNHPDVPAKVWLVFSASRKS